MQACVVRVGILLLILLSSASVSWGYELTSRYATISYEKEDLLRKFNKQISLGSLSYLVRSRTNISTEDEVKNKIDVIIERVEAVLDMHPKEIKIRIVMLSSDTEVQRVYKSRYNRTVDFIAFYAPKDKTVYLSVSDIRLGVLAHELAHVVIDHYFGVAPPVKIHEVLAEFAETHLKD